MTEIGRLLESFFSERKIEYYAAIDYSYLHETNPKVRERAGIIPASAIIFLVPYYVSTPRNMSAYASSLDYHIYIKELTRELTSLLKSSFPEYNFFGFGDHSPIDERHAALASGLGILGDSGMLINEKYGTYTFIADILTDMPPDAVGCKAPAEIKMCNHCGACRRACPTGILRSEGSECLSAITQKKGELTAEEVKLMRKYDTVWGCDICQQVCPHNKSAVRTPIDFFYHDRVELLTSEYLSSLSGSQLSERAFGWRGRNTVQRNLDLLEY